MGSDASPYPVVIALVVLALSGLLLFRITRRHPEGSWPRGPLPAPPAEAGTEALLLMASAGEALIDSGYDALSVRAALEDIARVNGMPGAEIIALPTALFVSAHFAGQLRTAAVSTGHSRLRLHQIEEVDDVVGSARRGLISPPAARRQIDGIRRRKAPFSPWQQIFGQACTAVALAVLLGGSWLGVAVAAVLGALVGWLMLAGEAIQQQYRVLLIVALVLAGMGVNAALGLVGITTVLDGGTYGLRTLITMTTTMVAIALGVLVGLAACAAGRVRTATPGG
jgi:uncharacterized membrane protein YjjP (DUF1212 family)